MGWRMRGVGTLASPWKEGEGTHATRTRATQASPLHSPPLPLTRVGFLGQIVTFVGAGVGWMWGGDACVAHGGRHQATGDWDEGDASVPTHLIRHPRPYGYEGASEASL